MPKRLIVVLAFPGVNLIDLTGPLQVFDTADPTGQTYRLVTVSEAGASVRTSPGLEVVTEPLDSLAGLTIDTLIVPGGLPKAPFGHDGLIAWLAKHGAGARRLCSISTGALLLAEAGLLEGHRVTTHWSRAEELQQRHPGVQVDADRIYINDGRIWTSGGVTAGIDLSLALVEEDLGYEIAAVVARQMVAFIRRSDGQRQFSVPVVPDVGTSADLAELHRWMAANLREDFRVERLADRARMSPRTFARVYRSQTGSTPAKTVEAIRLRAACKALEETDLPFKAIAEQSGLQTEQNLRRAMQRQFGIGPADYRSRFGRTGRGQQLARQDRADGAGHMYKVDIEDIASVQVATLLHRGAYGDLPFGALHGWGSKAGHLTADTRWIGIFYSHQLDQPDAEKVAKAAFTLAKPLAPVDDIGVENIFGGRYAVLHYTGPYSEMHRAGTWFVSHWLPASGEKLLGSGSYDEYLDAGRSVPPEELRTKVYFPLAPRA